MYKYMVVDDEALERKAIQMVIKRSNLPLEFVAEAGHGAEAVRKAAEVKPDLVFMDIKMPGMNGLDAAQEILQSNPQCQVIFLTAYDQFEYARKGLQMGAADYLLKPVGNDVLEKTCKRLIKVLEYNRQQILRRESLTQQLESSQPFVRDAFIYNLLHGCFYNPEELKNRMEDLNLEIKNGLVMVASIKGSDRSQIESVLQAISVFAESLPFAFVVPVSRSRVAVLLGHRKGQKAMTCTEAKKLAADIREQVAKETGIDIYVGIGNIYNSLTNLPRSYKEACHAANLADLLQGKKPVLHIKDYDQYPNKLHGYDLEKEKKLVDQVSAGDAKGAALYTRQVYADLAQYFEEKPIWVKARCLQLLGVLFKTVYDAGGRSDDLFRLNTALEERLLELTEKEELKEWLKDCVAGITELVVKGREYSSNQLIRKAQEYIEKNMDKNITLHDICAAVYLNPQYFSRLFKKEMGITFTEYLTQRRIERAKLLLKHEDLPVSMVAKKIGFADANYFSRVFSKIVGVPPSEYAKGKR